ncbi:hypothetical protein KC338_g25 [Hortaea werneckii]|nr:hypothetical protein KC338_g25 [Hortaea werneckii]
MATTVPWREELPLPPSLVLISGKVSTNASPGSIQSYVRTLLLDHLGQKQKPGPCCRRDGPIERFAGKESHDRESFSHTKWRRMQRFWRRGNFAFNTFHANRRMRIYMYYMAILRRLPDPPLHDRLSFSTETPRCTVGDDAQWTISFPIRLQAETMEVEGIYSGWGPTCKWGSMGGNMPPKAGLVRSPDGFADGNRAF